MTEERGNRTSQEAIALGGFVVFVAVAVMFAGITVTAADVTSADRTIEEAELAPGESTIVTVEANLSESGDPFVLEQFDPAFADVVILDADPFPTVSEVRNDNDELVGVWNDTDTVMIQYEVTIPEDADRGDVFTITGEVNTENETVPIEGDDRIQVAGDEFDVSITDTNDPVEQGEELQVTAQVENVGERDGTQTVEFVFDGQVVDSQEVSLSAGESETLVLTSETADVDAADYDVEVRSEDDADGVTVTVEEPPADASFDVSIADVDESVEQGEDLQITAEIENTGDLEDTQDIEFYFDGQLFESEALSLDGGETTTRTVTVDTGDVDPGDYDARVESEDDSDTVSVTVTDPTAEAVFEVSNVETNEPVESGETLEVTAEIENTGDGEGTQDVELVFDGEVVATEAAVTLSEGETDTVTFTYDTGGVESGDYDARVESDDDSASASVTVSEPAGEAFFAVSIADIDEQVEQGETLDVTVEVENTGDATGTQDIALTLDGETAAEEVTLNADETTSLTLSVDTAGIDPGEYTADVGSGDDSDAGTVTVIESTGEAFFAVEIVETNEPVEPGETLEVTVEVENTGDETGTQDVGFLFDGEIADVEQVTLDPGERTTLTFTYDTSEGADPFAFVESLDLSTVLGVIGDAELDDVGDSLPDGVILEGDSLTVTSEILFGTEPVDPGQYEVEVRSDDDSDTALVTIEDQDAEAFFEVTDVETNEPVTAGETVEVNVEVTNTGDATATKAVWFKLGTYLKHKEKIELQPGETTTVELSWDSGETHANDWMLTVATDDDTYESTYSIEEPTSSSTDADSTDDTSDSSNTDTSDTSTSEDTSDADDSDDTSDDDASDSTTDDDTSEETDEEETDEEDENDESAMSTSDSTDTQTDTPTDDEADAEDEATAADDDDQVDASVPGFGPVTALAALLALGGFLASRRS